MKRIITAAAIALLATAAHAAPERSTNKPLELYTGTYWRTVFHPLDNAGNEPVCVTAGRWEFKKSGATSLMMLKWQPSLGLFVHIMKTSWRFGPDIEVPIAIYMDAGVRNGTGTTMKTTGSNNSMIQINIVGGTGERFVRDFAATNTMTIKFKSGNEGSWNAEMAGSSEAADALLKCIEAVKANGNTSPVPDARGPQASSPVGPPANPVQTVPFKKGAGSI